MTLFALFLDADGLRAYRRARLGHGGGALARSLLRGDTQSVPSRGLWSLIMKKTFETVRRPFARLLGLCLVLASVLPAFPAALTLNQNAAVAFPDSANWNLAINFHPGDNEVVTLNPPVFSWPYQPSFPYVDYVPARDFQFQISTQSNFGTFLLNVRTPWNFYNFIAPMNTGTNPVYWRVAHIVNGATNFWTAARRFTIAPGAQVWDRSMLANQTYLNTRGQHPYMLFDNSSKAALGAYLTNAQASYQQGWGEGWRKLVGLAWLYMWSYHAESSYNAAWMTNNVSTNNLVVPLIRAAQLANLGYVWQITGDNKWISRNPQTQLRWAAQWYLDQKLWEEDVIGAQVAFIIQDLAVAYDMFYQIMTPAERAVVERCFSLHCAQTLRGPASHVNFYTPNAAWNPTNYSAGYSVYSYSPASIGTSHWFDNQYAAMHSALAGYMVSTNCRELLDMGMNYMVARFTPFGDKAGVNQGRIYGLGGVRSLFMWTAYLTRAFPEASFTSNPILHNNVEWLSRMQPAGWSYGNEPWGDGSWGGQNHWYYKEFGRDLACLTGSGIAWQHWVAERGDNPDWFQSTMWDFRNVAVPFFHPPPAPKTNTVLAKAFVEDGWVMASSKPTNLREGFTNGVGIIFQARPRGSEVGHSHATDLAYQIWAYGAQVTDGGGAYNSPISYVPTGNYTLLVDGIGPMQGYMRQSAPWCAKVTAFTNGADFTYFAAEGVNAYPRLPTVAGGDTLQEYYRYQANPPHAHLQSVQRQVLFQRRKYFVMQDTLKSTKDCTFTWLYHILEPTLKNPGPNGFTYTATNHVPGGPTVTVHVAHCAFPTGLSVSNMFGDRVYQNPINGSNYWWTGDPHPRSHALWYNNRTPAKNWRFLTVIYPVKAGDPTPLIRRLDDYTVEVTNGSEVDVISFDKNTTQPATIIIDNPATGSSGPGTVQNVRVMSGAP